MRREAVRVPSGVYVIIGAVVGGILAYGLQWLKGRRDARGVVRLVWLELRATYRSLDQVRRGSLWEGPADGPRRSAWDAGSVVLARILHRETLQTVAHAYGLLDPLRPYLSSVGREQELRDTRGELLAAALAQNGKALDAISRYCQPSHFERISRRRHGGLTEAQEWLMKNADRDIHPVGRGGERREADAVD